MVCHARVTSYPVHADENEEHCMVCTQASQGSVVNISSVAAERPFQGAGAYSVSKAAVKMLTKASALELAPSVRISLIMALAYVSNLACIKMAYLCLLRKQKKLHRVNVLMA